MTDAYFSGTSNVVLPVANKSFYPPQFQESSRLRYYSSLFNSVEVNSSFYKLPLARTVEKWSADTVDGFSFTFKVWKEITHTNGLNFNPEDVKRFINVVNCCSKKGCLLLQFPPKQAVDLHRLDELLMALKNEDWRVAVEFRHSSWYTRETWALLNRQLAGMVFHDLPKSVAPLQILDADFVYIRFHGPEAGYRGSYSDDFLSEYATYIKEWLEDGKTVYTYFNNTMGAAVQNLQTLNRYVRDAAY